MDYLASWLAEFPRDQLHVEVLEKLVEDPSGIDRVFSFLGLDPAGDPVPLGRANVSTGPAPDIAAGLLRRLRASYVEPNRALEHFLGRRIDLWA
jgi:hypothetical protein